jgi:polar amino acid transport system permease protein
VNATGNTWPWKILLAVILLGMAAATWGAVSKIDYEWRWYRVPQYFFYQAEELQKAPFDGRISAIEQKGDLSVVSLTGYSKEKAVIEVDNKSLKLKVKDEVYSGDAIGVQLSWKMGPLVSGMWTTIWISFVSGVLGLIIGLLTGLARISKNFTINGLAAVYIEFIRGTPLLVQIFIAYFFVGTVFNLSRNVVGVGALALFAGAYVAEIVRAGIQSISRGQMEAARSLGMTMPQAMIDIILPQALKRILPPLSGQFISLIKEIGRASCRERVS